MSLRTLPLLYLNLGGEMLYVLDQRLAAQNVNGPKAVKVLDDILRVMFNKKFLDEIFLNHQPMENRRVLRALFDKLAHASIMRLNESSMDKLYDLMVMAFKHQVVMTKNPHDLIGVTLNHLDAIGDYAKSEDVKRAVELAYELLIQSYVPLTVEEMRSVRCAILNFFQDYNVRVSVFINERVQNDDASFKFGPIKELPRDAHGAPGEIRTFDKESGEVISRSLFDPGVEIRPPGPQGRLGILDVGHRGTKHGLNMYANIGASAASAVVESGQDQVADTTSKYSAAAPTPSGITSEKQQRLAKQELDLLAKLIGSEAKSVETFKLNLFDKDKEEAATAKATSAQSDSENVVKIDLKGKSRRGQDLEKVIGEMEVDSKANDEEDDLLALMDKAI